MDSLSMNGDHHPLHIAMLPWLGFGHILSFIQLSNKLNDNGVKITFLTPPSVVPRIRSMLHPNISIVNYHLPHIAGLPDGIESAGESLTINQLLMQAVDAVEPEMAALLKRLIPHVIFTDFIHHWVSPLAKSLDIRPVYFSTTSAISMASITVLAAPRPGRKLALTMVKRLPVALVALLSGLKLYEARDGLVYLKKFHNSKLSSMGRQLTTIANCSAVAMKSATEIEGSYIDYFARRSRKPVILTGPLMSKPPAGELNARWESWLSKFHPGSVVFASFGSELSLPKEQIREIIAGLEMTGSPFLVVLNSSPESELVGERLEGRGIVHVGWVQQQLILKHPAIGVHLGHAGHNSLMEAVAAGCQVVLLPLCADQFLNTRLVVQGLKAGVAVKRRYNDGSFTRDGICEAVKKVMDGSKNANAIKANNGKLRGFLLNDSAQQKYLQNFVAQLWELVKVRE